MRYARTVLATLAVVLLAAACETADVTVWTGVEESFPTASAPRGRTPDVRWDCGSFGGDCRVLTGVSFAFHPENRR